MADEPVYIKSNTELDLERRQANGFASDKVLSTADVKPEPQQGEDEGRSYEVEGNDLDGYLNTDPMYQNYANETEKPGRAPSDSASGALEEVLYGTEAPELSKDDSEKGEDLEPAKPESKGPATSTTAKKAASSNS